MARNLFLESLPNQFLCWGPLFLQFFRSQFLGWDTLSLESLPNQFSGSLDESGWYLLDSKILRF